MNHQLIVKGPHCKSCIMLITDALTDIGATRITATLNEKAKQATITCDYNGKKDDLINAIKKEGYTA